MVAIGEANAQRPGHVADGPQVDESAGIAHLLRTAGDAVSREDWKLAIDSLQRVIDKPEGLFEVDHGEELALYESPRRLAQRRLAELPPQGLAAYRVLYDGRAKGLLKKAKDNADLDALREICSHYLLTTFGPEAADLWVSWLIDFGRSSEALIVLDDLTRVLPDGESLPPRLAAKQAVAMATLGDAASANTVVTRLRERGELDPNVLESLTALTQRSLLFIDTEHDARDGWSGPGGGGPCDGRMDAVTPTIAENLPWRRSIPSSVSGIWPDMDGLSTAMLPVVQPVAADGRVFVKVGREYMAVDVQSFAALWTSQSAAMGIAERASSGSGSLANAERAILSDYVTGTLTTSNGLVFGIERGDAGATFGVDGIAVGNRIRNNRMRNIRSNNRDYEERNRIVAFDARTGRLRWQRGRQGDPDERLQRAQFLAPPISVGEDLWVPFATSGDLYVGVLNPADGSLRRQILLCSLAGRELTPTVALFPATADGFVYVPTGHGMLFAIDASAYAVSWASRYHESPPPRSRRNQRYRPSAPNQWLSGPPVLTARLALLAPTDLDGLMAFDRLTGHVLWEVPRDRHRYIIAANSEFVWVGGDQVSMISLRDPSYVWSTQTPGTTGRAVLSGDVLYVPTVMGLMAIDASTGDVTQTYEMPSDQTPPGNLLCIGGSMLSVDPSEIRAFPDKHSYQATLAAHQEHPNDVRIAIRLAFMELLEDRPQRAIEALDSAVILPSPDAESQRAHLAHLRVESLIRLAQRPATPGDRAVELLHEAAEHAMSRRDRVSARLTLGDKLRRIGRYAEAYRQLWQLAQSSLGDEIVDIGGLRRPARLMAGDQIRRLQPELGPVEIEDLSREGGRRIDAAVAKFDTPATRAEAVADLRRLADSRTPDGRAQQALNVLGKLELDRGKFEPAEQLLRESIRDGGHRIRTAEAMLTLVDLYLDPAQSRLVSAKTLADRLIADFADIVLDDGPVRTLVNTRLADIDAKTLRTLNEAIDLPRFTITDHRREFSSGEQSAQPQQLVDVRTADGDVLANGYLSFVQPHTLQLHASADGELIWEAELAIEHFVFRPSESDAVNQLARIRPPVAVLDGETIIINGPQGLHAIGALSGKRLWAMPVTGIALLRDPAQRDRTIDAGAGRVACVLSSGKLTVLDAMDGSVVWERKIGVTPAAVRIRDNHILVADATLEWIDAYRVDNGASTGQMHFRQPVSKANDDAVAISYNDHVICGPDGEGVVGYDVRTGDQLWSVPLGEKPAGLFELDGGRFVVGTAKGRHLVIEGRSGKILREIALPTFPRGAVFGTIEDDLLLLAGYDETSEGNRWLLVGVSMDTGKTQWARSFVGTMNRSHLSLAKGVIPVVTSAKQQPDPNRPGAGVRYRQEIIVIDKRTGQIADQAVVWDGTQRGDQLTGDLIVRPGRLILQASRNIVAYETHRAAGLSGGLN